MDERRYSVIELDALRSVVEHKWLFGRYRSLYRSGFSRSYKEDEKVKCVEALVRTHMIAGHTADDLLASELIPKIINGGGALVGDTEPGQAAG